MALGKFVQRLLCRGDDSVLPLDERPVTGVPSNAQVVAPAQPQAVATPIRLLDPMETTSLLPSLLGERLDAPVEQECGASLVGPGYPKQATSSPPTSSRNPSYIQEVNINHVKGDYIDYRRITHTHLSVDPERDYQCLAELRRKSALGAVANAEERAYAPRCLHETRAKVLTDLEKWSTAEGQWKDAKLLVLTGPAGHGKTAIMQSFSEQLLEKSRTTNLVVVTFFFKVTIPEQNQPKALVTTLAHQIAARCPSIRRKIVATIQDDVGIFSTSLEHQMKHLILIPITSSHTASPDPSLTLICAVDGLDECDGDDAQSRVIRLLHTLSTTPNTRVVLASRPEFPIKSTINSKMSGTMHIDLNKDYQAGGDIRQFTWIKLLEIRDRLLPSIDRASWPCEGDAERIAKHASGQFILADTAMRYVDDRRYDPRERLEEVLALCRGVRPAAASPLSTHPLGALDTLFTGILERAARNAYPDMEVKGGILELASLVYILAVVIRSKQSNARLLSGYSQRIPLWVIEEPLGLKYGGLARSLLDLHSLLDIPQDMYGCKAIGAHHKSFLDFLGDPQRSGHLGDIPLRAKNQFDEMVTKILHQMTQDDLMKCLISTRHVEPHILHYLHVLCNPGVVINSIDPKFWKALLPSLNTWEMLCLQDWVFATLWVGPSVWTRSRAWTQAKEPDGTELWGNIILGISKEDLSNQHSVSDTELEELYFRLDNPVNRISEEGGFAFIPTRRLEPNIVGWCSVGLPWFPAARVLASLWMPEKRLAANHDIDRPIDSQFIDAPNPRIQQESQLVFIVGSPCSGKCELLEHAYELLPASQDDSPGAGQDWAPPPVDIIIVPDGDHLNLKSLWTSGSLAAPRGDTADLSCHNEELMGNIDLSHQIHMSLFQDWTTCWRNKDKRNTHQPQFLLQGVHLLSPDHQGVLLDIILSEVRLSRSTRGLPFFITVTSLPTEVSANKLRLFSGPGVYYVNLDTMKVDVAVVEGILTCWAELSHLPLSQLGLSKLARVSASSPRPLHHFTKLLSLFRQYSYYGSSDAQLGNRLDPILAAPESEAWRLIDELGDIDAEDERSEGEEEGDEPSGESDEDSE